MRKLHLFLILVITTMTSTLVVSLQIGEMECQADDEDQESVTCRFRVDPNKNQDMESCLNNDGKMCVNAMVSTTRPLPQEAVAPSDQEDAGDDSSFEIREPPTTTIGDLSGEKEFEQQQQQQQQQQRNLDVGEATYRPPYSQHGDSVASVLEQAPRTNGHVIEWANWYLELGNAHFPEAFDDHGQPITVDWYELELAVNALQRAISVFDDDKPSSTKAPSQDEFLASVYFNLGEAYFMDPYLNHLEEATESFQKAKSAYKAIQEHPEKLVNNPVDIELRYAESCLKVAQVTMASMGAINPQQELLNDLLNKAYSGGTEEEGAILSSTNERDSESLSEALLSLETAIAIYRRFVERTSESTTWNKIQLQAALALALQNAASASLAMGGLPSSKEYLEQAIALQIFSVLPNVPEVSPERTNAKIAIADLYLSLADISVQMGDYVTSKDAYKKAMDWHAIHNIEVAPVHEIMDDDEALQEYLDTLKEYREVMQNGGTPKPKSYEQNLYDEAAGSAGFYYEKDDGYEGDLLAGIGALYLSKGEKERGISFLEQALALYQKTGEDSTRPMADAKLNLSMGYFRARRFADSQRVYFEALDAYKDLYGDGVNPYLQGFEEYEELLMEAMGGQPQPKKENKGGLDNKMIDLEKFKQSVKNATEAATTKDMKEEL